jgi:phosphatidylinositol kinase/protein kinase (PI-3  family)
MTALEVKGQVGRLLAEATSDSNLLRMYIGWAGML